MKSVSGRLLGIQIGSVKRHVMPENVRVDYRHPFWTSAIFKSPIKGPVQVSRLAVAGDEQADQENHGGPDNVVLAYDGDHYAFWREKLGDPTIGPGSFGENFTVTGLTDSEVCIGDIWEVGEACADGAGPLTLQVTQARVPCFKLARRLQQAHIVKLVHETSWGGWYLRVLQEGPADIGMAIRLTQRLHPEWPVAVAVQLMYTHKKQPDKAAALMALPELSARWKAQLAED